uniref:Uncharacterized protein n=1 Tax=Arundo donax TaxID=35708 RepID=A0A0A8Y4H0_ARUDO
MHTGEALILPVLCASVETSTFGTINTVNQEPELSYCVDEVLAVMSCILYYN